LLVYLCEVIKHATSFRVLFFLAVFLEYREKEVFNKGLHEGDRIFREELDSIRIDQ
jgi:hypothetical protein